MWKDAFALPIQELQLVRQQYAESQRRERILVRRLANKEQEMQDYVTQITELKAAQAPGPSALKNALLDPAVNLLFQKLKTELMQTRARLEETQNELSAWKFTPDSNTGKRLMAKCRLLYQENEELGKMTSNGRLAKLEGDLALQKNISEELKKTQLDLDEVLMELEEDLEGMQNTIVLMQRELQSANEKIASLEQENGELRRSMGCEGVNGSREIEVNCGGSARTTRNVDVCLMKNGGDGEIIRSSSAGDANCNDTRTGNVCDGSRVMMGEEQQHGGVGGGTECSNGGTGAVDSAEAVDGENACSKSNKRTYDESESSEFNTSTKTRRTSLMKQAAHEDDESIKVQNFSALTQQNGTLSKT
ncbi:pre-mRNA-splicing regulator female-lethal(2)D isoform X2 [Lutzomyia longipalpis]|uniref:pre-mRNA-splicing regulator female-lethal(2)D isoform X2 n=1 Tax=Lutzomyia longipalpis TaxID=7200 RepID=UPI0024843C93|nr:pre-mRNA-splicing regulator female-lethal(2)D isoform X2 [Lutzomyia longipalpis]